MFILRSTWFGRSMAMRCRTRWLVWKGWVFCMQLSHDGVRWKPLSTPLSQHTLKVPLKGAPSVTTLWWWFRGEGVEWSQLDRHTLIVISLSPSLPPPLWNPIDGCIIYNTFQQWDRGAFGKKSHTLVHVSVKSTGSSALSGSTFSMMSLISGCLLVEVTALWGGSSTVLVRRLCHLD